MNELIAKITSSIRVAIRTQEPHESIAQPLYAVNWFDAHPQWMYHLSNSLAGRSVIKVGGKPLFKATVQESLLSDEGKRQIILLVKYPDGHAFKRLMESTYFKMVSLLRIKSVQRFTFSFTKPSGPINFDSDHQCYALHYFNSDDLDSALNTAQSSLNGLEVLYAGKSFAHLYQKVDGRADEIVENIINCIIIYGGDSQEQMNKTLTSEAYLSQFNAEELGYIASLNKVF